METFENPLFKESTDYISQNLQILSNEIPTYLLDYWILGDYNLNDMEYCPQFGVFMYALLRYNMEKNINEFELSTDDLMSLFQSWQIALALIEINNKTEVDIEPFKLFDFDNLHDLEITVLSK